MNKGYRLIILLFTIITSVSCGSKPVPVVKMGEYVKGDVVGFYELMPIIRADNQLIVCSDRSLSKIVDKINITSGFRSLYGLGGDYLFIISENGKLFTVSKYSYGEKEKKFKYVDSFTTVYPKLVYAYYNIGTTIDPGKLLSILFTDNHSVALYDNKWNELAKLELQEYSNVDIVSVFGGVFCYSKRAIIICEVENNKIVQKKVYKLPEIGNPDQIKFTKDSSFNNNPLRTRTIIDGKNLYQIDMMRDDKVEVYHSKLDCECELVGDVLLSCENGLYVKLFSNDIDAKIYDETLMPLSSAISLYPINDYYLFNKSENGKTKFVVLHIDLDDSRISFYETDWLKINNFRSVPSEEFFSSDKPDHRLFYIFDDKYRYLIDLTDIIFNNSPVMSRRVKM